MIVNTQIKNKIVDFRAELELYLLEKNLFIGLSPKLVFPKGACKGASMILGQFLIDDLSIDGKLELVNGYYQKSYLHAWLEVDGYIIDITADQFDSVTEKVILMPVKESKFHRELINQRRFDFDLSVGHHFRDYKTDIVKRLNMH